MRLLRRIGKDTFEFTKYLTEEQLPSYAVLSHTWLLDDELEVSFEDLTHGNINTKQEGFAKIRFCGEQAANDGLDHFWVDTCCIDRKSSSEVQEAITSMFSWYRNATRCYVLLADVSVHESTGDDMSEQPPSNLWESDFRHSRWFTRGWALQELLAPKSVEFFSNRGIRLGDKTSLEPVIHAITKIPYEALRGADLDNFSVEERLSWAANRQTKRIEDKAYCLCGIFKVHMVHKYGEKDQAFERLQRAINKKQYPKDPMDSFISTLPVAKEAAFNSLHNQHEATCLQDTRVELVQHITKWADSDTDRRCIFWLMGIAGSGKSTIARTIARTYYDRGSLGGSFFFSKGGGDLSKANKLATTLARQVATRSPEAKRHICEAIKNQEDIMHHSLRDQWQQLIIHPLSKLTSHSPPSTIFLAIDALDECDDVNDIRAILRLLAATRSPSNLQLRIFITSRPETPIRYGITKIPEAEREVFILHDIDQALVDQDLDTFFKNSFTAIREERGFDCCWPGDQIIKDLVKSSCGLFIWASTASRWFRKGRRQSIVNKQIHNLITGSCSGADPEKQLDQMYTTVLREFIQQDSIDEEREESCVVLRKILGAIVILRSLLSVESLAKLLDMPLGDVKGTLDDLHAIFKIPDQNSDPVRLHHDTFRDFLLHKERCIDIDFCVDEKQAHKALGDRCLAVMSEMLKKNICDLESPGTLVEDVDPDCKKRSLPPHFQYACLYWVEHYRQSEILISDGDPINEFFKKYFLYWLEAISLMDKGTEMGAIIRSYHSLLKPDHNMFQIPFVKDARRLMFRFQNIIKQAPLQIYCAAISFIPPTNELMVHFRDAKHSWIKSIRIAEADGPRPKDDFNYVSDLAFTPDSKKIASGSNFEAVRAWDVKTKATLCKYEGGARDKMSSVAISSDGKTLAGGSDDFTVMVWDIGTRKLLYSIEAHTGWVNSVVFSPNCKFLASCSMDHMVAIWDTATGKEVKRIDNQSNCVNSVAFSPNGLLIVTASADETLRVWDISNDSEDIHMMLEGHRGPINCARFSLCGKHIVSGSDDMNIKVWDTATRTECMTLSGHTKKVMAVAFSPDARLIASGSEDKTVRVWNATSGTALSILEDHPSGINAVLFSPNSKLLASSSFDDEVRLWDTKTWTLLGKLDDFEEDINSGTLATRRPYLPVSYETAESIQNFKGHSSTVTCVVFSPNGEWLASGSQDGTIKLWRKDEEPQKLEGHSGIINYLAFSPNSRLVASASTDQTMILWSLEMGAAEPHRIEGHSGNVLLVLFSADNQLLASCSTDNTIRLWDPATGAALGALRGHSDAVNGIAFSPDSRLMVSWSVDTTAILWDLSQNTHLAELRGHSGPVNSVAFSSDGKELVSCSDDTTIRFWSKEGTPCGQIECSSFPVNSVALSQDNQFLASCSNDKTVTLWDAKTKSKRGSLEVGVITRKVSFSRCGRYVETDRGALDIESFSGSSPYPSLTRPHALFVTEDWVRRGMENVIWLPDEYHATDVAIFGKTTVLGHLSGSISFIDLV